MSQPHDCERCDGRGWLKLIGMGLRDCLDCNGTGWADSIDRDVCANCQALVPFSDMHVSPDEDGNRNVCEPCCRKLDAQYAEA